MKLATCLLPGCIPDVDTLHNHRCENLKSYTDLFCLADVPYFENMRVDLCDIHAVCASVYTITP
jgi:hypothetical protein